MTRSRESDPIDGDEGAAPEPESLEPERREWQLYETAHGQRIDKVLATLANEFSRNHLQSVIEQGHVALDGKGVTSVSRRVRAGQRLQVTLWPTAQALAFAPQAMALSIVFEDDHVLVIDKPAALVVHPAAGNWSGTLLNGLLAHHAGAAALPRAGIVHRLDKDTTGLMVVAKTLPAMTTLVRAIAARDVQRVYSALVHGATSWPSLTIDAPIARDPQQRMRMAIVADGKPARTDVLRIARGGTATGLQCTLHSGRTHQVRVHLASRGHPLVGDTLYGGRPEFGLSRQGLHAARLAFDHPIEAGRRLDFERQMPDDMARAWQAALNV